MLELLAEKLGRRKGPPAYRESILHISDTPWTVFPFVERLIRRFHPAWIIHTGDLVDGAKVGLFPQASHMYQKRVGRIIRVLERHDANVFLVMGNHDIPEVVRKTARRSRVIEGVTELELGGLPIRVSHFPEQILEAPAAFNLFGHSLDVRSGKREGRIFLNGLEHAHVIEPATGEVTSIRYPWGTDDARLLRRRFKP